jgi:photosystem II stability/assembly factor-like uncharacterized protein
MATRVLVLAGTKRGAFVLESDGSRQNWELHGPFCQGCPINHVNYDPVTGTIYAAGGSEWFGPLVWRSADLGESWSHSSEGITYVEHSANGKTAWSDMSPKERVEAFATGSVPDIKTVWNVTPAHGALYAGVAPAGLFRSDDNGVTWQHVAGLREHPTQPTWQGGAGGLCLHTIVPHPTDPAQMWIAISSVGAFYTADGGRTWETRNRGVRAEFFPGERNYPEYGQCVHKLVQAPGNPGLLYQQNHCGVYRSADGGVSWQEITQGLPSDFGFPVVVHPHDAESVYVIPLDAWAGRYVPEGKPAVWRSRDGGANWSRLSHGLPQENAYFGVLREAMATDTLDDAGIYFGTGNGQIFASADAGDSWRSIAEYLPPVLGVESAVIAD